MNFNSNWKFHLMDIPGAQAPDYKDDYWRQLDLPHDWSVESGFNKELQGCTGYLPGGIGWYRKTFNTPEGSEGKLVFLNFDGIYNHADVYVNGTHIAYHPYGYTPLDLEISDYLNGQGEENVIAVRVDHSRYADSRWYTGSGIYRDVTLTVTEPCYIPSTGVFITTPEITKESGTVRVQATVKNAADADFVSEVVVKILSEDYEVIAEEKTSIPMKAGKEEVVEVSLQLTKPLLWDIDTPNIYVAETILTNGSSKQAMKTPFGFRTIEFHPDKGFFLNGKSQKIKGVCLHHDGGLVGAAVPKDVWRRRLAILREGGCNAIRTAHNPPSAEFLDLCDEMGFLVQDEFFDEWDYGKDKRRNMHDRHFDYITEGYADSFQEWAEKDLKNTMLRDRNHPSVIQWSIGNEIEWTYEATMKSTGYFDADASGNYFWTKPPYSPEDIRKRYEAYDKGDYDMGTTANKLSAWTKEMDETRPVILNAILPSADYINGVTDALDIIGYSYRRVMYDYCHQNFPNLPIMGTENLGQWHEWKAVIERDFISGIYIWTGIDYMGESTEQWPVNTTGSGLINRAGFTKPSWHMYKTLWCNEPHIHMTTRQVEGSIYEVDGDGNVVDTTDWEQRLWLWHDVNSHWNYEDETMVVVEVLSNCEKVTLFLDGISLGEKDLADTPDRIFKWAVPFKAGKLEAVGTIGEETVTYEISTAKVPEKVTLMRDSYDGESGDVIHVTCQLEDLAGCKVSHMNETIKFRVEGPWKILGVDNGSNANVQPYQSESIHTDQGRALVILKRTGEGDGLLRAGNDRFGFDAQVTL